LSKDFVWNWTRSGEVFSGGIAQFAGDWSRGRQFPTLSLLGVGDLLMSLIHTCELTGADPFDYLNQFSGTLRS
jgi:hypothetical protein